MISVRCVRSSLRRQPAATAAGTARAAARRVLVLAAAATSLGIVAAPPATAQQPLAPPPIYLQPGVAEPATGGQQQIYAIGDSLIHWIQYILPRYFPGWGVGTWGTNGRRLAEGMDILRRTDIPSDGSIILAMGLGTNEPPTSIGPLTAAVRESLRRVGPDGCVVWATIYRPPQDGIGYGAENDALRAMARGDPRIRLVDWSRSLHRNPLPMDDSGVHPLTLEGWQRRAQMFSDAARSCGER
jgi:hypothetical protein